MRLIDADAIRMQEYELNTVMNTRDTMEHNALARAVNRVIDFAPTADARQIKHGKWVKSEDRMWHICSCCNVHYIASLYDVHNFNFCPDCGAKMDL